jgi:hypothetical protein
MGENATRHAIAPILELHAWLGFGLAYPADLHTRDLTG